MAAILAVLENLTDDAPWDKLHFYCVAGSCMCALFHNDWAS